MGKLVLLMPGAALFCVGLGAAVSVQQQAPALNEDLRVEAVIGDQRTVSSADMYFEGQYLFQIGYGFLRSEALSALGVTPAGRRDPENARRDLATGVDHLEQSLRLDPANAYAWQAYAEGSLALGRRTEAIAALETSFLLGPHAPNLAERRIRMADILDTGGPHEPAWNAMVRSDRKILDTTR